MIKDSDLNELKGMLYLIWGWCVGFGDRPGVIEMLSGLIMVIGVIHLAVGIYRSYKGE